MIRHRQKENAVKFLTRIGFALLFLLVAGFTLAALSGHSIWVRWFGAMLMAFLLLAGLVSLFVVLTHSLRHRWLAAHRKEDSFSDTTY